MDGIEDGRHAQLLHALRALGLTLDDGTVTPQLEELILAEGENRIAAIKKLLDAQYPFVLGPDFDLSKATGKQLSDEFENMGVKGDTSKKCQRFFLALATEAGYTVSPHIKAPTSASSTARKRTSRSKAKLPADVSQASQNPPLTQQADANADSWDVAILNKFPPFDPAWPESIQSQWFTGIQRMMEMKAPKRSRSSQSPVSPSERAAPPTEKQEPQA